MEWKVHHQHTVRLSRWEITFTKSSHERLWIKSNLEWCVSSCQSVKLEIYGSPKGQGSLPPSPCNGEGGCRIVVGGGTSVGGAWHIPEGGGLTLVITWLMASGESRGHALCLYAMGGCGPCQQRPHGFYEGRWLSSLHDLHGGRRSDAQICRPAR